MANLNAKLDHYLVKPLKQYDWAEIMAMVPREGSMLELGVWYGTSFTRICELVAPRKVYGFDWWYGLPNDWQEEGTARQLDMGGNPPDCPANGEFVVGRVEYTLPAWMADNDAAAFVHFDLDLYLGTRVALDNLKFVPGAILVFDEIDNAVRNINHEQKAFREWLKTDAAHDFELVGMRHPEAWIVRLQ